MFVEAMFVEANALSPWCQASMVQEFLMGATRAQRNDMAELRAVDDLS